MKNCSTLPINTGLPCAPAARCASAGRYALRSVLGPCLAALTTYAIAAPAPVPADPQVVEKRIAEMHAQLHIDATQETQWRVVARTMRDNQATLAPLLVEREMNAANATALQDLDSFARVTEAHAGVRTRPATTPQGLGMNLSLTLAPIIALLCGILILVVPRMLNYIVAIYLIVVGLLGLTGAGSLHLPSGPCHATLTAAGPTGRLHRRAAHRSVGAKHAAIPRLRTQDHCARLALIKKLARVGRHQLTLGVPTRRAS